MHVFGWGNGGGLFSEDIIFPLKQNSKTCNWGLMLPSKTCAVWTYNILWNSWPVLHYTVRKTWHDVTSLPDWEVSTMETTQRVHWSLNPPSKTLPPLFRQGPLKPTNCLYSPLVGNTAIYSPLVGYTAFFVIPSAPPPP